MESAVLGKIAQNETRDNAQAPFSSSSSSTFHAVHAVCNSLPHPNLPLLFRYIFLFIFNGITATPHPQWTGQGLLIIEASRSNSDTHALGRVPLDERSALRKDLYLATHNTHHTEISMPPGWIRNPQSPQASRRRQTPESERLLGSANSSLIFI